MMRLETLIELKFDQFELFELVPLLKLDKQFPIEQFEATVSQPTVPSPLLSTSLACIAFHTMPSAPSSETADAPIYYDIV